MCTPGVNKEQSHRSTSHTCCSRLFPVRSLSVQILSEMMEAQERRPKLYTDTHSHAHSFIVIAFRHILTHCAHSQNFFLVQGRIVKIFPTRHHCLSATVFTSTTWTSCDYSSLTFFCTLTPSCLAELLFHRLTQVYEPKSVIDMAGRFVPTVDSTHDDEDNNSHLSDIPLQRPARENVSSNSASETFSQVEGDVMRNVPRLHPMPSKIGLNPWQIQYPSTYSPGFTGSSWTS